MTAATYPWGIQTAPMIERAAKAVGTPVDVLVGDNRARPLSHARWAVMLALWNAGWSTMRIGRALGNRDHTTVMHGLKKARELREVDADFERLCGIVRG
jgi:chromosomal replication initiator protein